MSLKFGRLVAFLGVSFFVARCVDLEHLGGIGKYDMQGVVGPMFDLIGSTPDMIFKIKKKG